MRRVFYSPANVCVDVLLQVGGLVKVDRVELKVIFVEGIVIIVIYLGNARFFVFFYYVSFGVVWLRVWTAETSSSSN